METLPTIRREYPPKDLELIKKTVAKDLSDTEFGFLMHQAQTYNLDPFLGEIWAVKYGGAPARIFTGKNGFLKVAHETGQLDGIKTGWRKEGEEIIGWAEVRRKDAANPFYEEVLLSEYKRKYKDTVPQEHRIWEEKPITMIQKVALVHALRLAFPISGLYAPEEFREPEKPPMKDVTPPSREVPHLLTGEGQEQIIDADAKQAGELRAGLDMKFDDGPKKRQVKKKIGNKWVWVDAE